VKKLRIRFCTLVIGTLFTHMRSEANRPERIANLQNTKVASAKNKIGSEAILWRQPLSNSSECVTRSHRS